MVVGSNPAEPIFTPGQNKKSQVLEELGDLKNLLELLVGPELKRKLGLRTKTNQELFELYDGELVFRHQSENALREARRLLKHFHNYLGEYPPTAEVAKGFLRQFSERKTTTFARYVSVVKGFMAWYGEPLDVKVSMPKILPEYVEPTDIIKLKEAMRERRTHKRCTERDIMLVDVACNTGLRRNELAELRVRDIDTANKVVIVRQGKGKKDRAVPLPSHLTAKLEAFIAGKDKDESVFGLVASSISGKIHYWAKVAGVDIHTHSLRDNYASTLNERGASIRAIQELLGHSSLANTERYTLLNPRHLRDVVNKLDAQPEGDGEFNYEVLGLAPAKSPERLKQIENNLAKIDEVFGPRK